ncbi:MAG: hypothetical protein FWC09_07350 [Lachnospiraceae bacterium]|nr:hypothetical protein [Lachnospiraceae bacterium]
MRKNLPTQTLLYLTIQENTYAKSHLRDIKVPPVYRSARCGKTHQGYLQYYFALVPEYQIFLFRKRKWRQDNLKKYLSQTIGIVNPDNYYLNPRLLKMIGREDDYDLAPVSLMEAMFNERCGHEKFHELEICLPADSRLGVRETVDTLLNPYLPRINMITLVGGEERTLSELADFFYSEYGIIAATAKRPSPSSPSRKHPFVLDLWSNEDETLKFLDTMVKNGYNTKVN